MVLIPICDVYFPIYAVFKSTFFFLQISDKVKLIFSFQYGEPLFMSLVILIVNYLWTDMFKLKTNIFVGQLHV